MSQTQTLENTTTITTETPIEEVMALWAQEGDSNPNGVKFGDKRGMDALRHWAQCADYYTGGAVGLWILQTFEPSEALDLLQLQAEKAKAKAVADAEETARKSSGSKPKEIRLSVGSEKRKCTLSVPGFALSHGSAYELARQALVTLVKLPELLAHYELDGELIRETEEGKTYNPADREATKAAKESAREGEKVKTIRKKVSLDVDRLFYPAKDPEKAPSDSLWAAMDIVKAGNKKPIVSTADEVAPHYTSCIRQFLAIAERIGADEELASMLEGCEMNSWGAPEGATIANESDDNESDD